MSALKRSSLNFKSTPCFCSTIKAARLDPLRTRGNPLFSGFSPVTVPDVVVVGDCVSFENPGVMFSSFDSSFYRASII